MMTLVASACSPGLPGFGGSSSALPAYHQDSVTCSGLQPAVAAALHRSLTLSGSTPAGPALALTCGWADSAGHEDSVAVYKSAAASVSTSRLNANFLAAGASLLGAGPAQRLTLDGFNALRAATPPDLGVVQYLDVMAGRNLLSLEVVSTSAAPAEAVANYLIPLVPRLNAQAANSEG
jgi:hypothetical protein